MRTAFLPGSFVVKSGGNLKFRPSTWWWKKYAFCNVSRYLWDYTARYPRTQPFISYFIKFTNKNFIGFSHIPMPSTFPFLSVNLDLIILTIFDEQDKSQSPSHLFSSVFMQHVSPRSKHSQNRVEHTHYMIFLQWKGPSSRTMQDKRQKILRRWSTEPFAGFPRFPISSLQFVQKRTGSVRCTDINPNEWFHKLVPEWSSDICDITLIKHCNAKWWHMKEL
jgi:hypothetical protein